MTAVRLPRLSRPGVLESISPKRLFALLQPYSDFFSNRSVPIVSPDSIDRHDAVAVELLLDRVPGHALGLEQGGEHSAADIVTAAWLIAIESSPF